MRRNVLTGCGLALAVIFGSGCQTSGTEQVTHLTEENQGLREQLADRNQAIEATQGELRDRDTMIAELRRQVDDANQRANQAEFLATPVVVEVDPFGGIEGVTGSTSGGEVTASVEADVLFDPGKSTLKESARRSLDAVVEVIRTAYAGKTVRVAGFTDKDPIRKSGYKTNYHLGFERAFAVREYLVGRGVAPGQVYVASHGPHRAKATKKESRRVEIAVVLDES